MQDAANFIGELGGDAWNTQSIALLLTGVLALAAAIITAAVTAKQGRLNRLQATRVAVMGQLEERKLQARQDWWGQFAWAAERLFGVDERAAELAAAVLDRLEQVPWASQEERDLVSIVLRRLNSNISEEDIRRMHDAQNNEG